MRGEELAEAASQYTIFSVGDGLVSQVPALLISTATGIIVTRAGAEASLSKDFFIQLFQNPTVLAIAAGMSAFLGIMPGLPGFPFFVLAGVLGVTAYTINQERKKLAQKEEAAIEETEVEEIKETRKCCYSITS
jgi:flagellar biosynthesis protein FlhA